MSITSSQIIGAIEKSKSFDKVLRKINLLNVENGHCLAELDITNDHLNEQGVLHAGFSATLIHNISTYGLLSHESGVVPTVSVDLHAMYMNGAKVGSAVQIDAQTIKIGKHLAFLEVLIKNKQTGELLVKGTHTKYFMMGKDKKIFVRM